MLINSHQERMAINLEKRRKVLQFLKEEIYTDSNTLKVLFNTNVRNNVSHLMIKMAKDKLVKREEFLISNRAIVLWGITMAGMSEVLTEDDELNHPFDIGKVRLSSLQHHLDNQAVRLNLEALGCCDWIHGDRRSFFRQFAVKHRPDGLITLPNGKPAAIETERTFKTRTRYQQIITSHLLARQGKEGKPFWHYVLYVLPDERKKRTLQKIFDSIGFIRFGGRPVTLEAKHRNVFRFYTMDELKDPKILLNLT